LLRSWVRKLEKICKCGWIASYKKVGAGHICMRKIHAVCPKGSENKDIDAVCPKGCENKDIDAVCPKGSENKYITRLFHA